MQAPKTAFISAELLASKALAVVRPRSPQAYLKDVLERLPVMTNQDPVDQLTPLNWKKARENSLKKAA